MTYFENIIGILIEVTSNYGPILGFAIIILESIIPILPLAVFITLNMVVFGSVQGFIISWVATIVGCLISFYIFRKGFSRILYRNIKCDSKIDKFMGTISKMKISHITLLVALPFTPAFMFNYAAGLSKIPFKKFFISILIGKASIVYFWGYVGTGLIDSLKNPLLLLEIVILMLLVYAVSLLIQKKLDE